MSTSKRTEYNQGSNLKVAAIVIIVFVIGAVIIGGLFVFALGGDKSIGESTSFNNFLSDLSDSADNLFKQKPDESANKLEDTNNVPSTITVTTPDSTSIHDTSNVLVSVPDKVVDNTGNTLSDSEIKSESFTPVPTDDPVVVHVIDIGQGDAILIEHNKESVMIDAGKSTKEGGKSKSNISAHLDDISGLKWLLTTHQDSDHIGLAEYTMGQIKTDKFMDNGNTSVSKTYTSLMQYVADNQNIMYHVVSVGEELSPWSDVSLKVIASKTTNGVNVNDDSVVVLLTFEGTKMALTGDISQNVETEIAYNLGDIDILKVAHHGSGTSSSEGFLSVTKPELSVISVGTNTYGHPTEEALNRLKVYGNVYRTDEYGCVEIVINNGQYNVVECSA